MNKKVVFLIVILECILAIFVVSIFGHAIEDARSKILCKEIYFVYSEGENKGQKIADGEIIELGADVFAEGKVWEYKLEYVIDTEKTSNKEVTFYTDKQEVKVTSSGVVVFSEKTDVTITVKVMDGSEKEDQITLIPVRGGGIVE